MNKPLDPGYGQLPSAPASPGSPNQQQGDQTRRPTPLGEAYRAESAPANAPVVKRPESLSNAIVHGAGFESPRKTALELLGLFAIAVVGNAVAIFAFKRYFVWLAIVPGPLVAAALVLLLTNEPRARPDGSRAPLWGRALLALATVAGLAGSFLLFRVLFMTHHHR